MKSRSDFIKKFQISQEIKDSLSKSANNRCHENFTNVISGIGCKLKYISSPMHYQHLFKCNNPKNADDEKTCLVKIIAHQKSSGSNMYDDKNKENTEITIHNLLSNLVHKKQTPHILLPIGHFYTNINTFTNLDEINVVNENEKYTEFKNNYSNKKYHENISVLISEFPDRSNFMKFSNKYYKEFTPLHWKVFFFQILSCLAVIQSKYPSFKHNNLKLNEVYVNKLTTKTKIHNYRICKHYFKIPNVGYNLMLSNFEFSNISELAENKIMTEEWANRAGINGYQNQYHDMHFFFSTLLINVFFPSFLSNQYVPQEAKDFVCRIIPTEFRNKKNLSNRGRLLLDIEYTTPIYVLATDQYFEEFRVGPSVFIAKQLFPSGWTLAIDDKELKNNVCPISLNEIMEHYCKCIVCNTVYDFDTFMSWFSGHKSCPMCRTNWNNMKVYKLNQDSQ